LETVVVTESFLHWVQFIAISEAFNSSYLCAIGLNGKHCAGFNCLSIYMNDTGPTLTGITTHMGAGKSLIFTDKIDEQSACFYFARNFLAVDSHRYARHRNLPK
jgi:hypothetical protein